jgi:hypothetical protein
MRLKQRFECKVDLIAAGLLLANALVLVVAG